ELPAVPARDPQVPLRIGPHPAQLRVLVGRLDDLDRAVGAVHLGEMAAGERDVPDLAVGGVVDAVWAAPFRILPDLDLPARVDSAVNARLAGKPVHAVLVECAGVEVGVAAVLRPLPHVDRLALRIVADDRVLPAVGHPRLAIRPEYHALRRPALARRHP